MVLSLCDVLFCGESVVDFGTIVNVHGGERGIRTPGPGSPDNSFRGYRIQPLCHLSLKSGIVLQGGLEVPLDVCDACQCILAYTVL